MMSTTALPIFEGLILILLGDVISNVEDALRHDMHVAFWRAQSSTFRAVQQRALSKEP